jgi:hypothetical protein
VDKVKAQLALVKQHSFWVMCGGILIVCLVSWYMSTKAIYTEQQKQKADIEGVFKGLEGIRTSNPKHPNAKTEEGMDAMNLAYSKEVYAAWEKQYQRQADVLVWPASFQEDAEFIQQVDKLRPIEIVPFPTPITSDLSLPARRIYRDYIDRDLPSLAKTIGTVWRATIQNTDSSAGEGSYGSGYGSGYGSSGYGSSGLGGAIGGAAMPGSGSSGYPGASGSGYPGTSGYPGASGSEGGVAGARVEDKSIVTWAPENQQQLQNTHFGFVSRVTPPTTLEVLYAQEDLWVLQNIMDIIRAANDDASARHEAAIKHIDFVRIGRSAIGLAGMITPVSGTAAGAGSGMEGGMMPGSSMMGSSGMSGPAGSPTSEGATTYPGAGATGSEGTMSSGMPGGMGGTAAPVDPAYGRYVDDKYAILDPAKLRAAHSSKSKEDALLAVAKRMPVRMRFRIDQRKMSKMLAECGNSKLPVEVRQVRLNRPAAAVGGNTGGYGSSSGYGSGGSDSGYGSGYGGDMAGAMPGAEYGSSSSSGYSSSSSGYGGYGGMSGAMPGSGYPGGSASGAPAPRAVGGASSTATVDYNLVDVEVYGIVYIYNPVNRAQLGLEPAGTAATAPPAITPTPAASPAPPTTSAPSTPPAAIVPNAGAE